MNDATKSRTDWDWVRKQQESNAPIPYDPEDGPYDPNDEEATEAWLSQATVTFPNRRGPGKKPAKRQVTLRLSPEVIDGFRAKGPGWHCEIEEALRRALGL